MGLSRDRAKKRRCNASYVAMPHHILTSAEYAQLSGYAVNLMLDLFGQFKGSNNGDLCAAWKIMEKRGWRSRDTLGRALKELLAAGFISKTRQGGRNLSNLYAVTWLSIDDCGNKLDVMPTRVAANLWKCDNSLTREACHINTPSVTI